MAIERTPGGLNINRGIETGDPKSYTAWGEVEGKKITATYHSARGKEPAEYKATVNGNPYVNTKEIHAKYVRGEKPTQPKRGR